ncbi:sulfotransferase domain-containing protein [Jannaschia sp. W003]|uniref:sulfotransferase domain-containing protein n=1 Tax=Jannaschia sp. W003 TaxID=2867012 RepID=UPI0021A4DE76|nr:sulfotransferase domain-containing protein [Jannaschia sp. W003]UWQ23188.1 sulfotransferase domain-containing protein [Jannaschia sp. W003]
MTPSDTPGASEGLALPAEAAPALRAVAQRGGLPHFFLVGAPKCATSSLHLALRRHEGVFMCSPKEPHFYSSDMPGLAEVPDEAAYRDLFADAPADTRRGEASAFYLASETAAAGIAAAVPDARIVISIRHPAEAAHSLFHQLRDGFREDRADFAEAWDLQEARARGEALPPYCPEPAQLQYRRIYSYHDQIARYFDAFGRDRVLVLMVDRIRSDPDGVMTELFRFLGLPQPATPLELPRTNTRRAPLVPGLGQFLAAPPAVLRPLVGPVKRALNRAGVKPSEFMMRHLSRPAAPSEGARLDPALRARLVTAFAEDVGRLETLLSRDLSDWKR